MKIDVECLIWPLCGRGGGTGVGRPGEYGEGGVRETGEEKLVGGSSSSVGSGRKRRKLPNNAF